MVWGRVTGHRQGGARRIECTVRITGSLTGSAGRSGRSRVFATGFRGAIIEHRSANHTSRRPFARASGGRRYGSLVEILAGFFLTLVLAELVLALFAAPASLRVATGGLYLGLTAVLIGAGEALPRRFGWANRITLVRAALIVTLAGLAAFPGFIAGRPYLFIGLALTALALDGVDGWVARITDTVSAFGARFDMELDAFFILVLCGVLVAIDKTGVFVLAIGLARYLFLFAQRLAPRLRRELPDSRARKLICVWQVVTLLVCLLPAVTAARAGMLAALSLVLLAMSFARDVVWLVRHPTRDRSN
ncbi:CDP-alcohol phosphatidyltransferase family protein [Salinisphaera sp. T31B1]|uniref:CDP-alcohol phosphatidyltransferase family protein n=1 Tax=Salinisphaera sp. T31B1 TaxID=727963 RepID=UPI00333FC84F